MASTSASSSVQKRFFKYDVFLSFRGEDTRKNFVDHLYHALDTRGITTYKDDEKIQKGKRIDDQLIKSIQDSKLFIIVFSKKYASSSWCLDELVHIMECHKTKVQTAYPVFYDVEPTEVRHQSGAVGEAFAKVVVKHENEEVVRKWRVALTEAAGLAGRELKTTCDGHEAKFIQIIVQDISLELRSINLSVDEKLVGMETRVKDVVSSLEIGFDDVRMIGIKGMGGGGKTTLARAVFDHISTSFEGKSFVENVREGSKGSSLKELQKKVLQNVLNDKSIDVESVYDGKNLMKKMMGSRKVLVVLDDVDDIVHLEALAGELNWFMPGTRIIITTRDEQVLVAHKASFIHDVNLLSDEEAICLFSRYAFGKEIPVQGYEELSKKVVHYAAGLPLTIKVLGSSLCGKTERQWNNALERLKTIPLKETLEKLELSYNGLENDQKEIFLDVACILKGAYKEEAIRILESSGFHAEIGLRVLEQKSLITISKYGYLDLHDHIEEMGRNIVRRLHPDEPNKHNRLFIKEEIEDIFVNDLGTEETRCIKVESLRLHPAILMKGLRKMKKLRFLHVCYSYGQSTIDEVDLYLPNALQSLIWYGYPFWCLPQTFQANKLVNLKMENTRIVQLWEGGERKVLPKLKFLKLMNSKLRTFNLGMTPNLKMLCLNYCKELVELHMPDFCSKLEILDLTGSNMSNLNLRFTPHLETLDLGKCTNLVEVKMPTECSKLKSVVLGDSKLSKLNLGLTPQLETLHIQGCDDLVEVQIPVECSKLKFLVLGGSKLSKLNLALIPQLETLHIHECNDLVEVQIPVECSKLKFLVLDGSKLSKLNLGLTPQLETLNIKGCNYLVEVQMPTECSKLKSLDLWGSKVSKLNLGLTPKLETLYIQGCDDLVEVQMPTECSKLKSLVLCGSKLSKLDLGLIPQLERLDIREHNDLVEVHMPTKFFKLKSLVLHGSKLSELNLGLTPQLETLNLQGCNDLVEVHMPIKCPKLKSIFLSGSTLSKLKLGLAPQLETLDLQGCNELVELYLPVECPKLKSLFFRGSRLSNLNVALKSIYLGGPKLSKLKLGLAPQLETLDLHRCNELVELHMPVECPKLKSLFLRGSKLSNLNLGLTPHLKTLHLGGCNELVELHFPVECPMLKILNLSGSKVSNLNLGLTPHLEELILEECYYLEEIHAPVGCLEKLVILKLSGCLRFEHFVVSKRYVLPGIDHLTTFELVAKSLDICLLHPDNNLPNIQFDCFYDQPLPLSSGNLEKLLSFGLCACTNLEFISTSICGLQHLRRLKLKGSFPEVPKDLHQLVSLEELSLSIKEIKHLPGSICMLKHLKSLKLKYCQLLEQLPMDLGRLEDLEELHLTDCVSLRDIPNNICNMKSLKCLDLRFCILVEKLPEEFGRLESLEEINIEGAGIRHLPQSIFQLKDLLIVGSTWRLESYGFTSLRNISKYTASFYIRDSQHELKE